MVVCRIWASDFLRAGQAANFVRPENKFSLPTAPPSFLIIDNAKVRNFHCGSRISAQKFFELLHLLQCYSSKLCSMSVNN